MLRLYQFALSGNCHKVRLMLSLLGVEHELLDLVGAQREHKAAEFLALNPFGQVPVLVDGDKVIRDSQAILVYLARRAGETTWLPGDAAALAAVVAWLSTAANEVAHGPNLLRLHFKFARQIDVAAAQAVTETLLQVMQARLAEHSWLASAAPTVADIAVYPYLALAPEAHVDLAAYPAVSDWLARVRALPGYVGMPGMLSG
ncbi:glutathione S-transferase [Candidatus Accumulibacter sp. ACC003]|uniref:glutathione S-transferase family protein n=1 Tax=Candidatus Accumulibacter sp. ACC003 TaxID=2823334 RepID=UPI0025C6BCDB|nr:glutathione S-transferase [Candidatus Accumulibacter sp. ACC003]